MSDFGWLGQAEADQLQENYLFLRSLGYALRIQGQSNSSRLPLNDEGLNILLKLLGYESRDGILQKFLEDYNATVQAVRAIYKKTINNLLRTAVS